MQLIGAGGAASQNDAANLPKPALARGEMRTIAATTWSVQEVLREGPCAHPPIPGGQGGRSPTTPKAVSMLRGVGQAMAAHHKVRILDEAIVGR